MMTIALPLIVMSRPQITPPERTPACSFLRSLNVVGMPKYTVERDSAWATNYLEVDTAFPEWEYHLKMTEREFNRKLKQSLAGTGWKIYDVGSGEGVSTTAIHFQGLKADWTLLSGVEGTKIKGSDEYDGTWLNLTNHATLLYYRKLHRTRHSLTRR